MRRIAFGGTLLTGLCLAILGFALSAPIGATDGPEVSNPRMMFGPGIAVVGVILIFLSAVVYELLPDGKE